MGTHAGTVLLYDLRSSRPVLTKARQDVRKHLSVTLLTCAETLCSQDHMYGNRMVDVKWHTGPGGERRIISSDTRIVKIWCARVRELALCGVVADSTCATRPRDFGCLLNLILHRCARQGREQRHGIHVHRA